MKGFSLFLFLQLANVLSAQNLAIEAWRTHFSYNHITHITHGNGKIFSASPNGFFYFDTEDNSINTLSKVNGLTGVGVTAVGYSESSNLLVIGYAAGVIDLLSGSGRSSITDLARTDLIGEKKIHDIQFWKDRILVATDLGVIVISVLTGEIIENYRSIGVGGEDLAIDEVAVRGDHLFARSGNQVLSGDLNDNLLDFNNWTLHESTNNSRYDHLTQFDNRIYSIENDSVLVELQGGVWVSLYTSDKALLDMISTGSSLALLKSDGIINYTSEGVNEIADWTNFTPTTFSFSNEYWVGTSEMGLVRLATQETIGPKGPLTDEIISMEFIYDTLYAFHGPEVTTPTGQPDERGYSFFDNYRWETRKLGEFQNLSDGAGFDGKVYFSSNGHGLYEKFSGNVLDDASGPFDESKNSPGVIIPDIYSSELLWVTAYDNPVPLWSMDVNNNWVAYPESLIGTDRIVSLMVSSFGTVWITPDPSVGGLIAFNPEENQWRRITIEDGLPSNVINDVVIDRNDELWVATSAGLAGFSSASFAFDNRTAFLPIFENNTLFEDEALSAVAIDGGNRLWVGGPTGLWVFNEELTEVDYYFNEENSPLPSNVIQDLEYNLKNGEMFILTDRGVVSFRSNSSEGFSSHRQVSVFPNPVRPGYTGKVGISGVVNNALIKITDINGKLIRVLEANGGTASWDLLDERNQRIGPGVYLVLSSSADGVETFVGKIAIIH